MAIESATVELGQSLPTFNLPEIATGSSLGRDALLGRPSLVMFLSNHCPYVRHVEHELARIGREYSDRVNLAAIASNDIERSPSDGPEGMREQIARAGFGFPYLHDQDQSVARAFGAVCTPDLFLYDSEGKLVYRGQLDPSRPSSDLAVTGSDLRRALDRVLEGAAPTPQQSPSIGCNIKWSER